MEDKKKKLTYDDYWYYSLLLTIFFFIFIVILYENIFYKYITIPICLIYSKTGLYCPACGMTRAFISLMQGKFLEVLYYNPAVAYIVIYLSLYIGIGTICKILKKDFLVKYKKEHIYIGIAILVINCIVRNILLIKYGIQI